MSQDGRGGVLGHVWETFELLKQREFRLFMVGEVVSMIGTFMQNTGQAWLAWELTKSPAFLGLVGMLGFLPFFVLGPWVGVWADRVNRRILLIRTSATLSVLAAILAFLTWSGLVQTWHVLVLAAAVGCVASLETPAFQAFVTDLSGIQNVRKSVVISNAMFQVSRIAGPIIAGLSIHRLGIASTFLANSLSFIPVIWCLSSIRSHQVQRAEREGSWKEFLVGIHFIRKDPRIELLFLLTLFMTMFGFSVFQILAAYVSVALGGGSKELGWIMGASGVGALLGSMVVVPITHGIQRVGRVLAFGCAWAGAGYIALSLSPHVSFSVAVVALASITFPVVLVNTNGLLQTLSPGALRGRLMGIWLMVSFGAQPLASVAVGWYADRVGVRSAVFLCGFMMLSGAIALYALRPDFRDWKAGAFASGDKPVVGPAPQAV